MKKDEKKLSDGLKALFVVVGAIVTVSALLAVLYNVFKKYFKITVECDGDCDECFDDFDEFDPVEAPEDEKEDEDDEDEDDEEEDEEEEEDE